MAPLATLKGRGRGRAHRPAEKSPLCCRAFCDGPIHQSGKWNEWLAGGGMDEGGGVGGWLDDGMMGWLGERETHDAFLFLNTQHPTPNVQRPSGESGDLHLLEELDVGRWTLEFHSPCS